MAMQFVLQTEPVRYWWPVVVNIPDPENAGKVIEQRLKILFEPDDQDSALADAEATSTLPTARAQVEHERQKLLRICKDWDDIVSADKRPIPFTEANFRAALQKSWFRTGVFRAYAESLAGEARLGN